MNQICTNKEQSSRLLEAGVNPKTADMYLDEFECPVAFEYRRIEGHVGQDMAFPAYYQGFIAGAEWQAKQLPWISTKDKLPDDEDLVITGCWCTDYFKYLQQGWYCRECNEWYDINGDKICVTHWMPILDLRNSINRAFKGGS